MKKYIFLYNVDEYDFITDTMVNKLNKANVDFKIVNHSIYEGEIKHGQSLWVLEEHYLISWSLINYEELLGIYFYTVEKFETTANDGVEWLERYRNEKLFVMYEHLNSGIRKE